MSTFRVFLVGVATEHSFLPARIRTVLGHDLPVITQETAPDFALLPASCIVTFSGFPDATLLIGLQQHAFKTIMLVRHPLDALLAFAHTQLEKDGFTPAASGFRDFVLTEPARTALSACIQWTCVEACHVIRHEEFAQNPATTLDRLCLHLGHDHGRHIVTPPLLERDAPGLWADVLPAETVNAACTFHHDVFGLLDYPRPSHDSPSAETCEQTWRTLINNPALPANAEKRLQRQLFALEDRLREKSRELRMLQKEPFSYLDRIAAKDRQIVSYKNEASRLHDLVYGVAAKRHLFRAWQVMRGDSHYRRCTPPAPLPVPHDHPATVSGYHELMIDGLPIRFHQAALSDKRGTGRVALELLRQFRELADSAAGPASPPKRPPVHFFAAPHWGPETLPERSCVMIHDVIPLVTPGYPENQRAIFEARCRNVIRQAAKIVTISQTSARDIAHHLGMKEADITVIYNGVTLLPVAGESTVPLPGAHYLVYVGGSDSHKNLEVVIEALRRPAAEKIHLVLIGGNERYRSIVESFRLEARVHFLGHLDDADMGRVIRQSAALVFPSYYEGFGLPPLEAARLGVPSLCSRRPAMTELLEDAAIFADSACPEQWARRIGALASAPSLGRTVGALAKTKAASFQWPAAARAYLNIFNSLSG